MRALDAGEALAGVHDGRGRAAPDRLGVYRNNVVVSLRDALRATFPVTERLMGETFFAAAAVAYAQANKPRSPLLFRYGDTFPAFLAELPGLADYPFVPETATLEYARLEAYHAADAAPLPPDRLAAVPQDDLARVVFEAHPSTRLLHLPHGGLGAWRANAHGAADLAPAPFALVTRPHMDVLVTPLEPAAAAFADALLDRAQLGDAAARDHLDVAQVLGTLLSAGAFRSLTCYGG